MNRLFFVQKTILIYSLTTFNNFQLVSNSVYLFPLARWRNVPPKYRSKEGLISAYVDLTKVHYLS